MSLRIERISKSYTKEMIVYIFWKHNLGKVNHVEFVPITESFEDLEQGESSATFHQVIVHKTPRDRWSQPLIQGLENDSKYDITFSFCEDPPVTLTIRANEHMQNAYKSLETRIVELETRVAELESMV
uniref:Uncharacterized protein n=1 Tax=viral metagenome TaxID=1070528 RepID=A0A6C0B686_9ZZZZ